MTNCIVGLFGYCSNIYWDLSPLLGQGIGTRWRAVQLPPPPLCVHCRVHKVDPLTAADSVFLTTKYVQTKNRFTVNDIPSNTTELLRSAPHGSSTYNATFTPNTSVACTAGSGALPGGRERPAVCSFS